MIESFLNVSLVVCTIVNVLIIAMSFGSYLDYRLIKDSSGISLELRDRTNSFFYTIFCVGLLTLGASYGIGIAASATYESISTMSSTEVTVIPGVLWAGGIVIVFEIVLIAISANYKRDTKLSVVDVRFDLRRELQSRRNGHPTNTTQLAIALDGLEEDDEAFRSTRKFDNYFSEYYESQFSLIQVEVKGRVEGQVTRRKQFSNPLIALGQGSLGKVKLLTSFAWLLLVAVTGVAFVVYAGLRAVPWTFGVVVIAVVILLISIHVDLLKLAKNRVLVSGQLKECREILNGLMDTKPEEDFRPYGSPFSIGSWEIRRRLRPKEEES